MSEIYFIGIKNSVIRTKFSQKVSSIIIKTYLDGTVFLSGKAIYKTVVLKIQPFFPYTRKFKSKFHYVFKHYITKIYLQETEFVSKVASL